MWCGFDESPYTAPNFCGIPGEGGYAGGGLGKKPGPIDGFVLGDGSDDASQGADAKGGVVWNTNALVAGLIGLKDEVTAGLMNQQVLVIFAEMGGQSPA